MVRRIAVRCRLAGIRLHQARRADAARPSGRCYLRRNGRMKLSPIKTASLVERLAAEVRGQIIAGKLAAGQSLPTEAQMAADFGVSRPLVREALAHLRAQRFGETSSGRRPVVQ